MAPQAYPHNPQPRTLTIDASHLLPRIEQIANMPGACAVSRDVEEIAASYIQAAEGDANRALKQAISDALADLTEAERRTHRAERLVSRGYARGRIGSTESRPLVASEPPRHGAGDPTSPREPAVSVLAERNSQELTPMQQQPLRAREIVLIAAMALLVATTGGVMIYEAANPQATGLAEGLWTILARRTG